MQRNIHTRDDGTVIQRAKRREGLDLEVFGIGLPEIILIAVIALIVLGPERLPEAARTIGKGVADLRRAIEPARSAWTELTNEVTNVTSSVTGTVNSVAGAASPMGGTRIVKSKPGEKTTAMTTDNPWAVHPITVDMTEDERAVFMQSGQIPERILAELQKAETTAEGNGRVKGAFPEVVDIEYPMPHAVDSAESAPTLNHSIEDLDYPSPPNNA